MEKATLLKLSVLQWVLTFLLAGPAAAVLMLAMFRSSWWSVALAYGLWYYLDRDCGRRGGRRLSFVRNWRLWRLMAEYFPAKLHRTASLSRDENYVLGFHPHGVLSTGAFLHFATEATGFSRLFPGITPYLTVLDGHFDFPLYREYLLCSGAISVRRESLQFVLRRSHSGRLVCVLPGGAHEALDSHPGLRYRLRLRDRLGFVRMALRTGSHLVPSFSFGEIDLFRQVANPDGSLLRTVQNFLIRVFGFSSPIFSGHGLLPFAKPINTVVGAPIHVQRNPEPTDTEVQQLLERYITELQQLFDSNKGKYVGHEATLEIL